VMWNMGLRPTRTQPYLTAAYMIAVVNSVVGGSAVALAVAAVSDPPLGVPIAVGALAALASLVLMQRSQMTRFRRGAATESLFPSDPQGAA
jgi:hypothetical protein